MSAQGEFEFTTSNEDLARSLLAHVANLFCAGQKIVAPDWFYKLILGFRVHTFKE